MRVIEITDKKISEITQDLEEMLTIGGRLMSCIEQLEEEGGEEMGFRRGGGMGHRANSGVRPPMGYRGGGGYRNGMMERGGNGQYNDPYYS